MGLSLDVSAWPAQEGPLVVPWTEPGNPAHFHAFSMAEDWLAFVHSFNLSPSIPQTVALKYLRAQKLYAFAWFDCDLIKAGELVALSALERALKENYEGKLKKSGLAAWVEYMAEHDGLTDKVLPIALRCGQPVVQYLYETDAAIEARKKMGALEPNTLARIRNGLAHGDPFDGLSWPGLLEIVRDLIEYAYRRRL
ncbi:hypothetical protein ISS98_11200 [Dyella flagellata]